MESRIYKSSICKSKIRIISKILGGLGILCSLAVSATAKDCIGVIPAGSGHAFWNSVEAGAKQAGRELGIEIYYRGPADESRTEVQNTVIERVLEKGCKGLVIAPGAPERAANVAALRAQGIPTVYIDRDTGWADVVGVIATNNYEAGKLAAEKMAEALQGKGNVALLRLKKGVASTDAREQGFLEGATAAGLTIVTDDYLGTQVGDARETAEKSLRGKLTELDGVFTPNESTTIGTLQALQRLNKAGQVIHIGFDSSQTLIRAMKTGKLYGLVVQQPFEMGYQGVYMAHTKSARDRKEVVDTGVVFATQANMERPEIRQLLHMDYTHGIANGTTKPQN